MGSSTKIASTLTKEVELVRTLKGIKGEKTRLLAQEILQLIGGDGK
jgi:hypothetical protein